MTTMQLSEAFQLGRSLLTPCSGGRKRGDDSHGCALDMALAAMGRNGCWTDSCDVWPWLRDLTSWEIGSSVFKEDSWSLRIATTFDHEVIWEKTMTMNEFGTWLKKVEERVAPPPVPQLPLGTLEIPVTTEVWDD